MVAVFRFLLPIALIVSAEAALNFKCSVKCGTGDIKVSDATATLDKCVEGVKTAIKASTSPVSGCVVTSTVTAAAETDGRCEAVGQVVAGKVTASTECVGEIYGTSTTSCAETKIPAGELTMKAVDKCVLTITTEVAETGGNTEGNTGGESGEPEGGNTGGNTGNTGGETDNTGGNTGNTGGETDNTGGNTGNTGGETDNTGGNTGNTGGETDNTGGNTGNTGGETDNTGGETAETGGANTGGEGNEAEGGDNTGSSGVGPALTLGCLTAVVAALK